MNPDLIPPVLGVVGLIIAFVIYARVKQHPAGEGKVVEIGDQIHLGAMVFGKHLLLLLWAH